MSAWSDDFERAAWNPAVDPSPWDTYYRGVSGGGDAYITTVASPVKVGTYAGKYWGQAGTATGLSVIKSLSLASAFWFRVWVYVVAFEGACYFRFRLKNTSTSKFWSLSGPVNNGGVLVPRAWVIDDGGAAVSDIGTVEIPKNEWVLIEAAMVAATAPGANDGYAYFFVNGLLRASCTGIDNDTMTCDYLEWKAGSGANELYTIFVDDFSVGNARFYPDNYPVAITRASQADGEASLVVSGSTASMAAPYQLTGPYPCKATVSWAGGSTGVLSYRSDRRTDKLAARGWTTITGASPQTINVLAPLTEFKLALSPALDIGAIAVDYEPTRERITPMRALLA